MKIKYYKSDGSQNGELEVSETIFNAEENKPLIHQALVRQLANGRKNIAYVKNRSDIAGGGSKPWRQKGTGRARQGTVNAPHWRGGGKCFGATGEENYKKSMPKKMRRVALFSAISIRSRAGNIVILENLNIDKPNTKLVKSLFEKINLKGNILFVYNNTSCLVKKSCKNLIKVDTVFSDYINVRDILKSDNIVFMEKSLRSFQNIFIKK